MSTQVQQNDSNQSQLAHKLLSDELTTTQSQLEHAQNEITTLKKLNKRYYNLLCGMDSYYEVYDLRWCYVCDEIDMRYEVNLCNNCKKHYCKTCTFEEFTHGETISDCANHKKPIIKIIKMSTQVQQNDSNQSQLAHFNGGKMLHIWKYQEVNEHMEYTEEFHSPEAEKAFLHGRFFYKIDGANGMVMVDADGKPSLYERYDDKKGKFKDFSNDKLPSNIVSLPPGGNPDIYNHHTYYYKKVSFDPNGKQNNQWKIYKTLFEKLDQVDKDFLKPNENYSIEIVGQKFQKTPGINEMATIAFHRKQEVVDELPEERTFKAIDQFLKSRKVEGLVIEYQGLFWKIRSSMMSGGFTQCPFSRYQLQKSTPEDEHLPLIVPVLL